MFMSQDTFADRDEPGKPSSSSSASTSRKLSRQPTFADSDSEGEMGAGLVDRVNITDEPVDDRPQTAGGSRINLDPVLMQQRLARQRELDRKRMMQRRNTSGVGMITSTERPMTASGRPGSARPRAHGAGDILGGGDVLANQMSGPSSETQSQSSDAYRRMNLDDISAPKTGLSGDKKAGAKPATVTRDKKELTALERALQDQGLTSVFDPTAGSDPVPPARVKKPVEDFLAPAAPAAAPSAQDSTVPPALVAAVPPMAAPTDASSPVLAARAPAPVPIPATAAPAQVAAPLPAPAPAPAAMPSLDFSDIRTFLSQPSSYPGVVQCQIVRHTSGLNKGSQKYTLYLEQGQKFLLSARKRKKKRSSNYLLSLDGEDLKRESGNYYGKLRANFIGTEFVGYDKGVNPSKLSNPGDPENLPNVRQELVTILYAYNVLGTRGPRKMTVVIPEIDDDGNRIIMRPTRAEDSLIEKFKQQRDTKDYLVMRNKSPNWNPKIGAYCLNFGGRVTKPSVKNFQLIDEQNPDYIVLQFGKTGKDTFTMDYQYPLSPIQAFLIALSSFDNKIACE